MSGRAGRLPFHHPRVRPDWLAMLREDVLEPDLPIIDPHHHLWDRHALFAPDTDFEAAGLMPGDTVIVTGWNGGVATEDNGIFEVLKVAHDRLDLREPLQLITTPQNAIKVERADRPAWRALSPTDNPPLPDLAKIARRPTVTGSLNDETALRSVIQAMAALGLIVDKTRL